MVEMEAGELHEQQNVIYRLGRDVGKSFGTLSMQIIKCNSLVKIFPILFYDKAKILIFQIKYLIHTNYKVYA